jgi:hypothetical protein
MVRFRNWQMGTQAPSDTPSCPQAQALTLRTGIFSKARRTTTHIEITSSNFSNTGITQKLFLNTIYTNHNNNNKNLHQFDSDLPILKPLRVSPTWTEFHHEAQRCGSGAGLLD